MFKIEMFNAKNPELGVRVCVTHKDTAQTHAPRQVQSQGTRTLTFKHTYSTHTLKPSLMLTPTIADEQRRNG